MMPACSQPVCMQVQGHAGLWGGMLVLAACHLPAPLASGLLAAGAKAVLCPSQPALGQPQQLRPAFCCALMEAVTAGQSLLAALQEAGELLL